MARGLGGLSRSAVVAIALTLLGMLVFSGAALGAGGPPLVPKPDPPPKAVPPPPPPQASRPPAPQPAAPVVTAPVVAPRVVHPRPARARAALHAKREAVRAARARRSAAKKLAATRRREQAQATLVAASGTPSSSWGLPFLIFGFSAALLILGLALTPARAVPWHRASRVLEDRREEIGVIGAMGLVASVVFFLLVQVTK